MNEQTLENLKYLLTNPYTWLFIIFTMCLPYILQYMRQFFSKKLQEQMAKEEACTLKVHEKPEMKRMRKNVTIGIFISFVASVLISYFSEDSLHTFRIIFMYMMGIVALYSMVVDYKVNKGRNCLKIYNKSELMTQVSIYAGLVVLLVLIIVMFDIGKIT